MAIFGDLGLMLGAFFFVSAPVGKLPDVAGAPEHLWAQPPCATKTAHERALGHDPQDTAATKAAGRTCGL